MLARTHVCWLVALFVLPFAVRLSALEVASPVGHPCLHWTTPIVDATSRTGATTERTLACVEAVDTQEGVRRLAENATASAYRGARAAGARQRPLVGTESVRRLPGFSPILRL